MSTYPNAHAADDGISNMLDRQAGEALARLNACPACHAAAGQRCTDSHGHPTSMIHRGRAEAVALGHLPYLMDDDRAVPAIVPNPVVRDESTHCAIPGCGHALSMHNSLGYCRSNTTPDRSGECICASTPSTARYPAGTEDPMDPSTWSPIQPVEPQVAPCGCPVDIIRDCGHQEGCTA